MLQKIKMVKCYKIQRRKIVTKNGPGKMLQKASNKK